LVLQDAEAGDVEIVVAFAAADVVDCYAVRVFGVVALGLAWWGGFDVVKRRTAVGWRGVEG